MKILLLVLAFAAVSLSVNPPVYNYSYHIAFDQAYTVNSTVYRVNGQKYYDPANNRERTDRANGRYNAFCGTVLPNVTTSCQLFTKDNKRWIVFPQRTQCCFCCDGAHGCGVLKPDWLAGAEYKGTEKIVDTEYDKWSKDGMCCVIQVMLDSTTFGQPLMLTKSQEDSTRTVSTLQIIMFTHSTTKQCPLLTLSSPFPLIVMRLVQVTALLNLFAVNSVLEHQQNDLSTIHNLNIFFSLEKLLVANQPNFKKQSIITFLWIEGYLYSHISNMDDIVYN